MKPVRKVEVWPPDWACFAPGIKPYARLILTTLMRYDRADVMGKRKGWVNVTQRYLAQMLDLSIDSVKRAFKELTDKELICFGEYCQNSARKIYILYENPISEEYEESKSGWGM